MAVGLVAAGAYSFLFFAAFVAGFSFAAGYGSSGFG